MIGTENQYIIYDDGTFNCPLCAFVHWPKDYAYHLNKHGNEFQMRCLNTKQCRTRLMVIVDGNIVKVTTKAWDEAFKRNMRPKRDYNNNNKQTLPVMPKINVQAHLKRYTGVEASQLFELINGLNELIEADRVRKISEMEDHIEKLKKGEFPTAPAKPPKAKIETQSDQQADLTIEEPIQTEAAQEEALDNL